MIAIDTHFVDPVAYSTQWETLAQQLRSSPFVRPGWVLPWHRAFGAGRLLLLAALREDRVVGLVPLQARRGRICSPSNWHTPEFSIIAEDADVLDALLAAALNASRRRIELSFVDAGTANRIIAAAADLGRPVISRVLENGPYLSTTGSFAEYDDQLGRHFRAELRRRRRKLSVLGDVVIDVHESADPEALEQFFRVEGSGWKGRRGTAVEATSSERDFYLAVARWAAPQGWLRLALLRVGDTVIAGDLTLQCDGVQYLLKTGYDEEYRAYGPGKLLRYAMIERAFSEKVTSYEFLGDQAAWKMEWTMSVRPLARVQVFGRGRKARLVWAAYAHGRPAAKAAILKVRRWLTR